MMNKLIVAAAAVFAASSASALTIVTVEAPGAVNTTATFSYSAVETFDAQPTGNPVVVASTSFAAIGVAATFSFTQILPADQFGGAGGTGNQVAVRNVPDLDITFTGAPLNYFGVWASALDGGNAVAFYKGGTLLSQTQLTGFPLVGNYSGNPSGPFAGANTGEQYAFFNFVVEGGYDRAVLIQNGGGGFELDNVTVGFVPEPASWALMIAGFGMVGISLRRRKAVLA